MHGLLSSTLRLIDRISPPARVSAHCDIPCGIYDPHLAQVAALTCVRMNQLIQDLGDVPGPGDQTKSDVWHNSFTRYVATKEHHAELVKHEVRIITGDYFKPEHVEKYPDLFNSVFNIMKLASKVRQNVDMDAAQELLSAVAKFAEVFWETKGVATKRQPSNQAAGGEYVVPA